MKTKKMKMELVFIPSPGIGHLASAVELGKRMVHRDPRLSATFFVMRHPFEPEVGNIAKFLLSTARSPRLRLLDFPADDKLCSNSPNSIGDFLHILLQHHAPSIRASVAHLVQSSDYTVAGIVLDMFCVAFTDIADEFNLPSYMYFPCSAAFLGLLLHSEKLHHDKGQDLCNDYPDALLPSPIFTNPVPIRFLPTMITDRQFSTIVREMTRKYRRMRSILVNTFLELEHIPLGAMAIGKTGDVPPIYPVGPVISDNSMAGNGEMGEREIVKWLDEQPEKSVVFVCFGSMGSVSKEQAGEIAVGLERCGQRFLWVLRMEKSKDLSGLLVGGPVDGWLPDGFLERTEGRGRVVEWAPQVRVLGHRSVGGFVSHCGWNSVLESFWFGVPMAAWPMFAEQQVNAFQLTREMGLGVEMTLEYRKELMEDANMNVSAEEIERCVGELMGGGRTKTVLAMEDICRRVRQGSLSYECLDRFLEEL